MATRRARIKAVASLPVRRKQNNSNENKSVEKREFLGDQMQNDDTKKESEPPTLSNNSSSPQYTTHDSSDIKHNTLNRSPQTRKISSPRDIPKSPRENPKTPQVPHKKAQVSPKTPYSEKNSKSNERSSKRKQPTPTKICEMENQVDYDKISVTKDEAINNLKSPETSKTEPVRRRIMRPAINIPPTKRMKLPEHSRSIVNAKNDNLHSQNGEDKKSKSNVTPPMMPRLSSKTNTSGAQKLIPIDKAEAAKLQEVDLTDIDGIVPLQSKSIAENLDAVKKDIISDVAKVNFDPIIPLHSPSKVRHKLRPAPRLAGRRNSLQGSASESEEDVRKLAATPMTITERRKSASACPSDFLANKKNVDPLKTRTESQIASVTSPSIQTASTTAQTGRSQSSKPRSGTGIRRRLRNPTGNGDNLTMYDLIFFNPTTNPIVPGEDEVAQTKKEQSEMKLDPYMGEEGADDPEPASQLGSNEKEAGEGDKEEEPTAMPVPQIKLGPNGEIILDEKSLVIETTESKTRQLSGTIVRETGGWGSSGAGRYTRSIRAKDWADDETVRFYRALATIGTDFSLMMALFPGRSRRDLKVKFKKEERNNGHLVDKAMFNPMEFNMTQLMEDFKEEQRCKEEEKRERERILSEDKERLLEEKNRLKAISKSFRGKMGTSQRIIKETLPKYKDKYSKKQILRTADELVEKTLEAKRKARKPSKKKALMEQQRINQVNSLKQLSNEEDSSQVEIIGENSGIRLDGNLEDQQHMPKKRVRVPGIFKDPTLQRTPSAVALDQHGILHQRTPRRSPATVVPPMFSPTSVIPKNVEVGSLVVLTTEVPGHATQKMLQTYITGADGKLTPIALPTSLLGSVMKYVRNEKDNNDKALDLSGDNFAPHVRQLPEPIVANSNQQNSPTESTSGNRTRHNSYSITSL